MTSALKKRPAAVPIAFLVHFIIADKRLAMVGMLMADNLV